MTTEACLSAAPNEINRNGSVTNEGSGRREEALHTPKMKTHFLQVALDCHCDSHGKKTKLEKGRRTKLEKGRRTKLEKGREETDEMHKSA